MKTIEQNFENYIKQVYPLPPSSAQLLQLKNAFFAGYTESVNDTVFLREHPEEVANKAFDNITREIEAHFSEKNQVTINQLMEKPPTNTRQ